jgi:hypothetical protein
MSSVISALRHSLRSDVSIHTRFFWAAAFVLLCAATAPAAVSCPLQAHPVRWTHNPCVLTRVP